MPWKALPSMPYWIVVLFQKVSLATGWDAELFGAPQSIWLMTFRIKKTENKVKESGICLKCQFCCQSQTVRLLHWVVVKLQYFSLCWAVVQLLEWYILHLKHEWGTDAHAKFMKNIIYVKIFIFLKCSFSLIVIAFSLIKVTYMNDSACKSNITLSLLVLGKLNNKVFI